MDIERGVSSIRMGGELRAEDFNGFLKNYRVDLIGSEGGLSS